jgi:hypothetical protein
MLDEKLLKELQEYVDIKLHLVRLAASTYGLITIPHSELERYIENTRKPTFQQVLFSLIDKKGANDSDIYKKAGIDRRHFSKIRSNPDYHPSKNSVIALSIALELNKKETGRLLSAAGFSLSNSVIRDLVIQFFLEKKVYDIDDINQALDYFSLKPLVGVSE